MQDIAELLRFLEEHSERFWFDSALDLDDQPAVQRLFKGVRAGQYVSDADAASDVFPGASADPAPYMEARSVLRERLSRAIERFVLHLEQKSDAQQVHIECQKLWLNIRTLSGRNAAELALQLAGHLLRIAEKFDLTMLCMDVALYLRLQNCMRDHAGEACADADSKYYYYRQVHEAEFLAEKSYTDLIALRMDSNVAPAVFLDLVKKHTEALLPSMRQYSSGKLHLFGNMVRLLQYTAAQDYAGAMHLCESAIQFFQARPYHARDAIQVFHYQMLLCSMHLRDAEAGARSTQACLELSGNNALNQFKIKELYILLLLHTRQYREALECYRQTATDPQFAFLPVGFRQGWMVYAPYLQFLTGESAGVPSMGGSDAGLGSVLKEHGHPGLYTAYLIAQYLLLLREKRHEDARQMAVELESLAKTQLAEAGTWRSRLFLLMLAQVPAGNFHPSTIMPLAVPFLVQLRTAPMTLANQTQELEVVPYEDLWALALEFLPLF